MRRGLGLALVHRIVRRAGGTMTRRARARGQFDVWLPAQHNAGPLAGDRLAWTALP